MFEALPDVPRVHLVHDGGEAGVITRTSDEILHFMDMRSAYNNMLEVWVFQSLRRTRALSEIHSVQIKRPNEHGHEHPKMPSSHLQDHRDTED
jgi:hypothetical protein